MNHIISIKHFPKVKSHYLYRMFSQGQTILSLQNVLPRSNLIISTKHFTKVKPHYLYKTFSPRSNLNITIEHFPKVKPHYLYKMFSQGQTTLFLQNPFSRSNLIIFMKLFSKSEKAFSQGQTSVQNTPSRSNNFIKLNLVIFALFD